MNKLRCNCDLTSPSHEKQGFTSKEEKIHIKKKKKNTLFSKTHHSAHEIMEAGEVSQATAPGIFSCLHENEVLGGYKNQRWGTVSVIQEPTIQ